MNVLVAGGTGFVGSAITNALLASGHQVGVLSRSVASVERAHGSAVTPVEADATDPASLDGKLEAYQVLVDAVQFPNSPIENPRKGYTFEQVDLQGTRNLVDAAKAAGTSHYICMSGVGASEDGRYHWLRAKWQEEQYVIASGIPYTIFRPSWIYGAADVSLNRFLGFARWLPFVPMVGTGKTRVNAVLIDDVGRHVAAAIGHDGAANRTFEIGGPDVYTMNEVVKTALRVKGKRRLVLPGPKPLLKPVAAIAQFLPGRPLTPGAVDFITMDAVADNTDLVATFGLPLTPLEEGLRTYLG